MTAVYNGDRYHKPREGPGADRFDGVESYPAGGDLDLIVIRDTETPNAWIEGRPMDVEEWR